MSDARTDGSGKSPDEGIAIPFDGERVLTTRSLSQSQGLTYENPPIIRAQNGQRKVALIGAAPSIVYAPWYDPSWEIWSHATCHHMLRRVDRFFDQHPWAWILGKHQPGYLTWLRKNRVPIYMADRYADAPASIRYPLERIQAEFPWQPFGGHAAFMTALALSEGVTHLGFFGIEYEIGSEYGEQRANAEFWAGIACGRNVQLVIPKQSPFCHEPRELYAYETHVGPEAQQRWKRRQVHRKDANLEDRGTVEVVPLEESLDRSRTDLIEPKNVENSRRIAAGLPPLLPDGVTEAWPRTEAHG